MSWDRDKREQNNHAKSIKQKQKQKRNTQIREGRGTKCGWDAPSIMLQPRGLYVDSGHLGARPGGEDPVMSPYLAPRFQVGQHLARRRADSPSAIH